MPGLSFLTAFVKRLNESAISYVITGAVASIIYGEPRLTHDVDILIMMKTRDIEGFIHFFPPDEFYCPPIEVLNIEIRRPYRGHFNLIHHETGTKADIYYMLKNEWAKAKELAFT